MVHANRIVLTLESDDEEPPDPPDITALRALLQRTPQVLMRAAGGRTFVYSLSAEEIAGLQRNTARLERPTPDGVSSALIALAEEAREIALGEAAWAIELAVQLINLRAGSAN
jgi:hypothetical protein